MIIALGDNLLALLVGGLAVLDMVLEHVFSIHEELLESFFSAFFQLLEIVIVEMGFGLADGGECTFEGSVDLLLDDL